jgi:hypothetical protein
MAFISGSHLGEGGEPVVAISFQAADSALQTSTQPVSDGGHHESACAGSHAVPMESECKSFRKLSLSFE